MRSRLFDSDPATGIVQVWHEDPVDHNITIETSVDVENIVDANKAEYNSLDERARWNDLQRVASIPLTIYWELEKQGITRDQKALRKWLNDPDNRVFRTRPGRI